VTSRAARALTLPKLLSISVLLLGGGALACGRGEPARSAISAPIGTTGAAARELLARPGFAWRLVDAPHARLHVVDGSKVQGLAAALTDSIEAARSAALRTLGEAELPNEAPLELFLVDTREDMQRLMGRPIAGFAQPGELTAAFVAGPGFRPFFRHELTHAYAAVRWGKLSAGEWLTEGLAALAQGRCQGHAIDEIAAGFLASGQVPPLPALRDRFREFPELPSYIEAASVVQFLSRERGMGAIRSIWQGGAGVGAEGHPLGADGEATERRWRAHLRSVPPAALDSVRLVREGC
jgi:hypothetical protein